MDGSRIIILEKKDKRDIRKSVEQHCLSYAYLVIENQGLDQWGHLPVVTATWEIEIMRIMV
jgi:hypothetical protein